MSKVSKEILPDFRDNIGFKEYWKCWELYGGSFPNEEDRKENKYWFKYFNPKDKSTIKYFGNSSALQIDPLWQDNDFLDKLTSSEEFSSDIFIELTRRFIRMLSDKESSKDLEDDCNFQYEAFTDKEGVLNYMNHFITYLPEKWKPNQRICDWIQDWIDKRYSRLIRTSLVPSSKTEDPLGVDDRIVVDENKKDLVNDLFMLFADARTKNDKHPLMLATDVKYFLHANFKCFNPKLPRKLFPCPFKRKTHLPYFIHAIFEAINGKQNINNEKLKEYRSLLGNFEEYSNMEPRTIVTYFKRKPEGYPASLDRRIEAVKHKHLK
jgi:hypothetical protein